MSGKIIDIDGVPSETEWRLAQAPSFTVNNEGPVFVFAAVKKEVNDIHFQVCTIDGETLGILRCGNQKTRPFKLKPGSHVLEINTIKNAFDLTVWGFVPFSEDCEIDSLITDKCNIVYPGFEIMTNAVCPRSCPGCNQESFMKNNSDYEYTPENARKLIELLAQHNRHYNLIFSGGEPALWSHLDEVLSMFRKSPNVHRIQLVTSCYDEGHITNLKKYVDRICISVRNDRPDLLDNRPEYMNGVDLWDQRFHRVGEIIDSTNIYCGCMNCGVSASIFGDEVYPCTISKNYFYEGKWIGLRPISVEDYVSGTNSFAPIGSYYQCRTCLNNFATPSAKYDQT